MTVTITIANNYDYCYTNDIEPNLYDQINSFGTEVQVPFELPLEDEVFMCLMFILDLPAVQRGHMNANRLYRILSNCKQRLNDLPDNNKMFLIIIQLTDIIYEGCLREERIVWDWELG